MSVLVATGPLRTYPAQPQSPRHLIAVGEYWLDELIHLHFAKQVQEHRTDDNLPDGYSLPRVTITVQIDDDVEHDPLAQCLDRLLPQRMPYGAKRLDPLQAASILRAVSGPVHRPLTEVAKEHGVPYHTVLRTIRTAARYLDVASAHGEALPEDATRFLAWCRLRLNNTVPFRTLA